MANYLILDTETANTITKPLVYDIGFIVVNDKNKVLLKRNYLISEIYDNNDLMDNAYYGNKRPIYDEMLNKNLITKKCFNYVYTTITNIIKQYKIKEIFAYNMAFDNRALNNTIQTLSNNFIKKFFDKNIKLSCIWNMACSTILNTNKYRKYCKEYNLLTEKGYYSTNAENCYNYLTNKHIKEDHMALSDTEIELEILIKVKKRCGKKEKKMNGMCWKKIQKG